MRPYVEDLVARAELAPDAEVLEVAAGTGALTVVAARACKRILATDFSEGMLALLGAVVCSSATNPSSRRRRAALQ